MKRRVAILLLIALPVLLVIGWALLPTLSWDGGAIVEFEITVVDVANGQPVSGATIVFMHREPGGDYTASRAGQALTDSEGRAHTVHGFAAGGQKRLLWRQGSMSFLRQWLSVAADGYEPRLTPVLDFTGPRRSIRDARVAVTVGLQKVHPSTSDRPSRAHADGAPTED